jgi:integrase
MPFRSISSPLRGSALGRKLIWIELDPISLSSRAPESRLIQSCAALRALFSSSRLRAAGLTIVNPFAEVDFERQPSVRYRSTFSVAELTAAAQAELGAKEFMVFLLAAFTGLRRDEIAKLLWTAFRWEEGVLRLEATEHFAGKSAVCVGMTTDSALKTVMVRAPSW